MVVNRNIARPFPPSREKACSRLDGKCRAMFRLLSRTCEIISRTFDIVCRYYHEIPTRRTRTIYIWYKRDDSLIKKCVSGLYLKYCHFPWNMKKKKWHNYKGCFFYFFYYLSKLYPTCFVDSLSEKRKQMHASSWHLLSKTTICECSAGIWINFDTIWTKFYLFRCVKTRNVSFYLLDYSLLSISHISRKKVDLK